MTRICAGFKSWLYCRAARQLVILVLILSCGALTNVAAESSSATDTARYLAGLTPLVDRSSTIVQDDTGIPLRFLRTSVWSVLLFGRYQAPGGQFSNYYQPEISRIAQSQLPIPAEMGFGYFSWVRGSHFQIISRRQ